jgi:hypothetical protein
MQKRRRRTQACFVVAAGNISLEFEMRSLDGLFLD